MKALKNHLFSTLLVCLVLSSFITLDVIADVIVDNGDSGTSYSGTWLLSGGLYPYGDDSLWARDGAIYTWQFDSEPAGNYEVLMWWSEWPSRATEINVQINYDGNYDIVTINQHENAGKWNSLGTYYFDPSGSVAITAAYGSTVSTCADAVWFRYIPGNIPPTAHIDSILPNPADPCEAVEFAGHGEDSDGTVVTYSWSSNIDGNLSDANIFSMASLSEGIHTISFAVQDNNGAWSEPAAETLVIGEAPVEVIIDNLDAETSQTGTWQVSGAAEPYEENSFWSRDGSTFSWHFIAPQSGEYEMSMWWTEWSSRSTNVPVDIEHSEGTDRVYVNQQQNGGQWNSIETYYFNAETSYTITVTSQPYPSSTCADAVKFNLLQTNMLPTAYIDSITPNPAELEDDIAFFGHGTDTDGTVVGCNWECSSIGQLSDEPNFVMNASVIGEGVHTISFNVMDNNNAWSSVVTEILTIGNLPPTAIIDSITPNPANVDEMVFFSGHGEDSDGTLEGYSWVSSIDGNLSDANSFSISTLSAGEHTISFRVYDDDGAASEAANMSLTVEEISSETIIDNRDFRTSSTGTWLVSGGYYPYNADSFWSRDGSTFSWIFTPATSGYYDLSMWWTQWPSRSSSVPVDIEHAGTTSRVYINQQQNVGQWNSIGNYLFEAGSSYRITITAQPYPTSTCADAVRFILQAGGNIPPMATIDSITPNPAQPGENVTFTGHGTDSDGTIEGYNWRSNIDGQLSDLASFSISTLSIGTHTIYFRVRDNQGLWSPEVNATFSTGIEDIYVSLIYNWEDLQPQYETMLQNLGASLQGGVWTYVNSAQNQTYRIHFVQDIATLSQALKTDGSHIIFCGHSNYGLGPVYATASETARQVIESIQYVDDDRILNISTPWVHVNVTGMRTGQAYPYWWPEFQDGTSAIMPYDFGDPRGDPAYNYYITYQVPGDPNHYKVESVLNSAVIRYSDSSSPPWYSATGEVPDPNNPDHLKHYITNPTPWFPSFETVGVWQQEQEDPEVPKEYFKENYIFNPAGSGNDKAMWLFSIPKVGEYNILTWWPALSSNSSNAPFTVSHPGGETTVQMDQRINGQQWNQIGKFYFDVNDYSVVLTDNVSSGNVVADAVRIAHIDNPPDVVTADFVAVVTNGSSPDLEGPPRSGVAPLMVMFVNTSTGDLTGRQWDFGDGLGNTTRDFIDHTYTSPGTYTITLTVSGPAGSDTKTKVDYITVGTTEPEEPLLAEFAAINPEGDLGVNLGAVPLFAFFFNISSGDLRNGITYIPAPGFTGVETFTYTVENDHGTISNEATVTVEVYAGNIPPTARDDSAGTDVNTPVTINVLANDTDADGSLEPNSVAVTAGASDGVVEVNNVNGTVTYTPDTGYVGTDTFMYTVDDNEGGVSNEATVTINPVVQPLTAKDDLARTGAGIEITIDILENDSDSSGTIDPGTIVVTNAPGNGAVMVHDPWLWDFGDGTTSHEQNPMHFYMLPGNYAISLTITDAYGNSVTETKQNFVRAVVFEKSIDNVDYPKTHYRSKTLLFRKDMEVEIDEMKYSRMLYDSCNSGNYYLGIFHRGITFYTLANCGSRGSVLYLEAYLQGKSDEEIWEICQNFEPCYDYYNFNEKPPAIAGPTIQSALNLAAAAVEPTAVTVNSVLDPSQMEKIQELEGLTTKQVFERLQGIDFAGDQALLHEAVTTVFEGKHQEIITLCLDYIKSPITEVINEQFVNRASDVYIAKKILKVFSDESVDKLQQLYENGNVTTKGNVIRAAGALISEPAIKNMLIAALDNKSFVKDVDPEATDSYLRICDLAYNQLVLHCKIKGVLRTIGTMHSTEIRDYHIDILKSKLM